MTESTMTTATLRSRSYEAEQRGELVEAARLLQLAIDRYPGSLEGRLAGASLLGALAEADIAQMREQVASLVYSAGRQAAEAGEDRPLAPVCWMPEELLEVELMRRWCAGRDAALAEGLTA